MLIGMFAFATCQSIKVNAGTLPKENKEQELKDAVVHAVDILEKVMNSKYEQSLAEIKSYAVKNNLNYELTMENALKSGTPYKDFDYVSFIAAYAALKQEQQISGLADLPFIEYSITPETMLAYRPVKLDKYVILDNDTYTINGSRYVMEPMVMDTFQEISSGIYKKSGTTLIQPDQDEVVYGNVTYQIISADKLISMYDMADNKKFMEIYKQKKNTINTIMNGRALSQSVFLNLGHECKNEELVNKITQLEISENRKILLLTAASLYENVPYQWGGKATAPGWDKKWYTFDDNNEQIGLDCSGFVQWSFMTSGYEDYGKLLSTSSILENTQQITRDELIPGDLGLLNTGEDVNHVGIYLGNDEWIHCTSSADTVTTGKQNFTVFRRVADIDETMLKPSEVNENKMLEYTEEDIILLAKTISHEAKGEGLNGWIAVAEVILNRVNSEEYPDNIYDVIYQNGQFSRSEEIANENPKQEIIDTARKVLNGEIGVLNNSDVLWFRNAYGDTESKWYEKTPFITIGKQTFYN